MFKRSLLFLFVCSSLALRAQVDLARGLVGKYCLDGDGIDLSNLANHGTISNATATADRFGNSGAAMSFSGNNSYLAIVNPDSVFSEQYSYSFWYNSTANPAAGQARIMLGVGGSVCDQTVNITNGYFNTYWGINAGGYYNPSSTYNASHSTLPPLNQWNHIVSVKTADSIKLYINGKLMDSKGAAHTPCYQGSDFGIKLGGRAGHNQFFAGKMDDLWLYNRALSDEEVAAIYNFDGTFNLSLGNDTSICGGDSIQLDAGVENATYLWSTGVKTRRIIINTPGVYWVRVNRQCTEKIDTIVILSKVNANLPSTYSKCSRDTLLIFPTNNSGSIQSWNTGSTEDTIAVVDTGIYTVLISSGSCSFVKSTRVFDKLVDKPNLGENSFYCNSPIVLTPGNTSNTILWSDNSNGNSLTANGPGVYWVRFSNDQCYSYDSITILPSTAPERFLPIDTFLCPGSPILVLVDTNEFKNLVWSDGTLGNSIIFNSIGTYFLDYTYDGCAFRDSIQILGPVLLENLLGNDTLLCEGDTHTYFFINSPEYTYLWNDGSSSHSKLIDTAGVYGISINYQGCIMTDSVEVQLFPKIDVPDDLDTSLCYIGPLLVSYSLAPLSATYTWSDGSDSSWLIFNQSESKTLTIQTQCSTYSRRVSVDFIFCDSIFVPNSFTPNGDNINDEFSVSVINPITFWIRIYDRWGEEIYYSDNPDFRWKGIYENEALPTGVYVYLFQAQLIDGKRVIQHGNIHLIR